MTKTRLYTIRLAVGIGVAGLIALACSALLDTGSLNSLKREAGPTTDAKLEGVKIPDKTPPPPPDLGKCVPGPMTCTSAVGACKNGTKVCYETTSVCKPGAPAAEKCDNIDSNCNGKGDIEEPEAITQCKALGQFCNGTACVAGCYDNTMCTTNGNTCNTTTHKCVCGTLSYACSGKFKCVTNACVCGSNNLGCGSGESCDDTAGTGTCVCGATTSTTGKACAAGTSCKGPPATATCQAVVDAGPDKSVPDKSPVLDKPPVVVDKPPIDNKIVDKAVDKPPVVQ